MNKVLILGAYGFLGSSLSKFLKEKNLIVFRQGRKPNSEYVCDPNLKSELSNLISRLKPDCIINTIADTSVDGCELNFVRAFQINCLILENIISAIKNKDIFLIHISTDQVYEGFGPHIESAANPINSYAITKYMSEKIALSHKSLILRTNFVGKSNSKKLSFTDWAISSFLNKKEVYLFRDVFFNPVHISFLNKIIKEAIERKYIGVFNLGSKTGISKSKFIKKLTKSLNLFNPNMKIISVDEFNFNAKRPKDMVMNSSKFEERFHINVPSIEETLELLSEDYKHLKNYEN